MRPKLRTARSETRETEGCVFASSGTNINEALMRAVQMLVRASSQGLIDPRSVSMIILVSDGDPTVGKSHVGGGAFFFALISFHLCRLPLSSALHLQARSS